MKYHEGPVLKCDSCDFQVQSENELKIHKETQHPILSQPCEKKCEKYDELHSKYDMLKENYERLILINKKLQLNSKDKEYALEIQMEELRSGYEKTKKENVKFQDNLETQNKLWKMWILKFEEQPKEVNSKPTNPPENVVRHDTDDEILLVEDEEDIMSSNDKETADDDETELIFETYIKNLKETGFRRTNPAQQPEQSKPETQNKKKFVCITCNFTAKDSNNLKEHLRTNHTAKNVKEISEKKNEKQTKTQYCHY